MKIGQLFFLFLLFIRFLLFYKDRSFIQLNQKANSLLHINLNNAVKPHGKPILNQNWLNTSTQWIFTNSTMQEWGRRDDNQMRRNADILPSSPMSLLAVIPNTDLGRKSQSTPT